MPPPTLARIEQVAKETGYYRPPEPRLGDVIERVQKVLLQYIDFSDESLATVIACWIAQTYCYECFNYCGYLALRSPTPRCGKSRLLKLIRLFCVDPSPITTQPTGASLYRSHRKIHFLDEVDQLRNKDKETFGLVLSVLNSGFEREGIIVRCEKEGTKFVTREYPTYGPKALAGIERLADSLADRCFHIPMKRTPRRMPRLNLRKMQSLGDEIRTQLTIWFAWFAQKDEGLQALYDQLPDEISHLKGFDDRFQDICEPSYLLAELADTERESAVILPKLLQGLHLCSNRREPSGRERDLCAFLEIVESLLGGKPDVFIESERLLSLLQQHEGMHRIESTKGLASFLGHFDLAPQKRGKRGYMITRNWIAEWDTRYRQGEEIH